MGDKQGHPFRGNQWTDTHSGTKTDATVKRDDYTRKATQHGLVGSPEFKAWFRDSKIVDKKGDPLVVYHGTKADFTTFDTHRRGSGSDTGSMFTASRKYAENYGRKERGGRVISAYLKITNPLDARRAADFAKFRAGRKEGESFELFAKRTGHDGAITTLNEYVVFEPGQVNMVEG